MLFHQIQNAHAIVRQRGLYRQTDVFHYDGAIFVRHCGGFARVMQSGTSIPTLQALSFVSATGRVVDLSTRARPGKVAYHPSDWT